MVEIVFPVLNEERRLRRGIEGTLRYLDAYKEEHGDCPFCCLIADNGSDDETPRIGAALAAEHPDVVRYLRIETRGVGVAFRTAVAGSSADLVGTMDIDLSVDIENLGRIPALFAKDPALAYVNGTRFARGAETIGRKWYRKITSAGLVALLRAVFGMRATDAISGFSFLRREAAERLVSESSDDPGWFYMIELLLRAERDGLKILELPVRFTEDYDTTVNVPRTICNYLSRIRALKKRFRQEEKEAGRTHVKAD